MKKSLYLILCFMLLICLASCGSSSSSGSEELMHFEFRDISYAVPDSWADDTSDPDMYVHLAGDKSIAVSVASSEVDPDVMTVFAYLDSQGVDYEPLQVRVDGVDLDGASYTNSDGDLVHTYYYVSGSGSPYMINVYLFDSSESAERSFLETLKFN